MSENRCSCNSTSASSGARETVCIDTNRVLDSCRDRDCYENVRVYLSNAGQEIIDRSAATVRVECARILCTHIDVDEIQFNRGFYQLNTRFYIQVRLEACTGMGRAQEFDGIAVLDKTVILYGGEGNVSIFRSDPEINRCTPWCNNTRTTNLPTGVVETVDPVVLGLRVVEHNDCNCPCYCACTCEEIPRDLLDQNAFGDLCDPSDGNRLYVSLGLFTVFRIERPAQFLVTATDYSVPDKECTPAEPANPCSLFRNMAFPTSEFSGVGRNDKDDTCRR